MREQMIVLNEQLIVGITTTKKRTIISLYENGIKKLLSDKETGNYFWSKVAYNEYYIVAYSRGCMVNQIPLNIDAVYSIKDKKMLDLCNKRLRVMLEYMLVCRKAFDLTHVLTTINSIELGLVDVNKSNCLADYLTCGNSAISHEQILWYILNQYPKLRDYINLVAPISVVKYKEIVNNLAGETYYFHVIPQELHKLPSILGYATNSDATDYMQIYISEAEQSEKK